MQLIMTLWEKPKTTKKIIYEKAAPAAPLPPVGPVDTSPPPAILKDGIEVACREKAAATLN